MTFFIGINWQDMIKSKSKEYHRPFMVVETFVPNEFVAGCVNPPVELYSSGVFCFDLDDDKNYDTDPNEQSNLGGEYLGGNYYADFLEGRFRILNRGRYIYQGGKTYLYIGTATFNDNGTYSYLSNEFAPLFYADLEFDEHNDPGIVHKTTIYFTGSDLVTNAS